MTLHLRRWTTAMLAAVALAPGWSAAKADPPAPAGTAVPTICSAQHPSLGRGTAVPATVAGTGASAEAVFLLQVRQGEPVRIDAQLERAGLRSRMAIGICSKAGYREQRFTRFLAGDRRHAALGFTPDFAGDYLVRVTSATPSVALTVTATTIVPGPPPSPTVVSVDDREVTATLDPSAPRRVLLDVPYRLFAATLKKGRRYLVRYSPATLDLDVGKAGSDFWSDNFDPVPDLAHAAGDGRSLLSPATDGSFLLVLHAADEGAAAPVAVTLAVRELPAAPVPVPVRIAPGTVINSRLDFDDATITKFGANVVVDENRPYKLYRLEGRRGDSVTVCMTAKFATVLEGGALLPFAVPFASVGFNDDADATAPNSRMQVVFADKGSVIIRAEAAEPGGTGPFELRIVRDTSGSVCPFDQARR